jgi:outer membrane protein assembly factor BamB
MIVRNTFGRLCGVNLWEAKLMKTQDMIFVGLNARVAALDRSTGDIIWEWRSPKPRSGDVIILVDQNIVVAAVNGYIYGLNPQTGEQLWFNELKGYGIGITSLATVAGSTSSAIASQEAAHARAAAAGAVVVASS